MHELAGRDGLDARGDEGVYDKAPARRDVMKFSFFRRPVRMRLL